jgi:hypothetical protein
MPAAGAQAAIAPSNGPPLSIALSAISPPMSAPTMTVRAGMQ